LANIPTKEGKVMTLRSASSVFSPFASKLLTLSEPWRVGMGFEFSLLDELLYVRVSGLNWYAINAVLHLDL
jgi:hypothetical protein